MDTKYKGYNLTTALNNLEVSYDDIGEGGTPIIFLHGYPFDKTMWQPQLDFLSSRDRAIAYDIRGFGESRDEKSPLSINLFADDLIEFMDNLSIKKAIVCGLSMGGYIALNAYNRFSYRFEALILCDTQCIADTTEAKEKRYNTIEDVKTNGIAGFKERFIKSIFHKDSLNHKKDMVEMLRSVVASNSKHIITAGLAALAERAETCSTLSKINIPTLIVCGREDELTPLAQSEYMHKHIKESILHVIDNAGHISNLEQPEVFNKHLLGFLTGLTKGSFEKPQSVKYDENNLIPKQSE